MRKCYVNTNPMSSHYGNYFIVEDSDNYGYECFYISKECGSYIYQDEFIPFDMNMSGLTETEKIEEHYKIEAFNALPFEIQIAKCLDGFQCNLADCIEVTDKTLIEEIMSGM